MIGFRAGRNHSVAKRSGKDPIRVGVIGYGASFNMGRAHLTQMKAAGMKPVAMAELLKDRREAAAADFPGIETYGSVAAMLKKSDVELLAIITEHYKHAALAVQCLKAGRHVVCEKPFAVTTAQCDAMIAAARKSKTLLSTYHNRHWDGCILQAMKTIRSGAIGEVVRVKAHMANYEQPADWWRSSKRISGGVLYDWGVHLLEYTLQIMNARITEVSGFAHRGFWAPKTAWKKDTVEDEGFAVVRFANGTFATLCISSMDAKPSPYWLEVTGTQGTYSFDYGRWELITPGKGETVTRSGKNPPDEGQRFYDNIAAHLMKGEKLVITPEYARRPVHILDLACASAAKGRTLKAKYG